MPIRSPRPRAGFSLVELLVVIAIIAIIVAIIVPALGGVRRAGRVSATTALANEVKTAAGAFQNDERRLPGYFTAAQMGSSDNATRGFTGMNNILLDLSGGIVRAGSGPTSMGSGQIRVGPTRLVNEQVVVDPALIGSAAGSSKGYFVPTNKNFVKHDENQKVCTSARDHYKLPDLVDAFGDPLLAWAENEAAATTVTSIDDFAQVDSSSTTKPAARFYWNSNGGLLKSPSLGKLGKDQTTTSLLNVRPGSSGGSLSDTDKAWALTGLLGNMGFPDLSKAPTSTILPTASRGKLVIQSAGADGVFLSKYDANGKAGVSGPMRYGHYFAPDADPAGSKAYKDGDRSAPVDFVAKFDDILASGGS